MMLACEKLSIGNCRVLDRRSHTPETVKMWYTGPTAHTALRLSACVGKAKCPIAHSRRLRLNDNEDQCSWKAL
eukprot:749861-Hanusia_phi.AAC.5